MTKSIIRYFFAICLVGIIVLLIQHFLFPFIYKIKEPYFAMPLKLTVNSPRDLPIRHDVYGGGEFGAKRKNGRRHEGLDLAARMRSPVYASKSGWARTYRIPRGYGNLVVINHPGGWQTRYGHLDKIAIKKFQWVRQGEIIGLVGKTGNANVRQIIPHLHFEIRYRAKPLDPAKELAKNKRR